jgi:hypothetical protein
MEIPPNLGKFYIDAFRASFSQAVEGSNAVLGHFPLEFHCNEAGAHASRWHSPNRRSTALDRLKCLD